MTEDSKSQANPVPDSLSQCAIFCLRILFKGFFFSCNFCSNSRTAVISYISSIFPEGNKSSTDAGENQSWKHNSIQTFAKICLLALKAGLIYLLMFLPGALEHVPGALELAWNNVLLPFSLTSLIVPPDAKKVSLSAQLLSCYLHF